MSNVLRLALVDPNEATRESLKNQLLGMDTIWLEAECSHYEYFPDVVEQTSPNIALVTLDTDTTEAIDLVATITQKAPGCAVLVICSSNDGNLILQSMRAGAKEFIPAPVHIEDLAAAINRIAERQFGGGDRQVRQSEVVTISGVAGGVGTTCLAVNLAASLAQNENNSVVLVDLDLCLGDTDVQLDMIPDYSLTDVAQNVSRLDFSLLRRSLTKHSSGLFLLPRPSQMDEVDNLSAEDVRRVIALLKAAFTHVVIDISKGFTPIDVIALEMATRIYVMTQLDLPCLRNIVRLLSSFDEMEGLGQKSEVVINRVGMDHGQITVKKAQETIGEKRFWELPNDFRSTLAARNNGVPLYELAPKAPITHAIQSMADDVEGRSDEAGSESSSDSSKSWFKQLLSK
jgi:pilus assembly protein CpaE